MGGGIVVDSTAAGVGIPGYFEVDRESRRLAHSFRLFCVVRVSCPRAFQTSKAAAVRRLGQTGAESFLMNHHVSPVVMHLITPAGAAGVYVGVCGWVGKREKEGLCGCTRNTWHHVCAFVLVGVCVCVHSGHGCSFVCMCVV